MVFVARIVVVCWNVHDMIVGNVLLKALHEEFIHVDKLLSVLILARKGTYFSKALES